MTIREFVAKAVQRAVQDLDIQTVEDMLEIPPEKKMGDYAFPCFRLAKQFRKAPALIAQDIVKLLVEDEAFEKAEAVGPYVNLFLNKTKAAEIVADAYAAQECFGSSEEGAGKTIVLDYSSINIAKPFHIGHLRTTVIGNAIHKLYRFLGYQTVRVLSLIHI